LPNTVAAPDRGFIPGVLDAFARRIQLYGSVLGNWEIGSGATGQTWNQTAVTGVQVGVTLASLVNGGWRITPYVVDSIYDHATKTRYHRHNEATERRHVLDPVLGVRIRRELLTPWLSEEDDMVLFTATHTTIHKEKAHSRYSMQEMFVGLVPARQTQLLLLMAMERDHLLPLPRLKAAWVPMLLSQMGRELLIPVCPFRIH
jgi:cell division protein FtsI (penicillin-binding protein 3)